ncbi:MAG: AI-2E family transporter [bacterium]
MPDRRAVFRGGLLFFTTALVVVGVVYFAVRLGTIITWLILAWIIASGLSPFVTRLEQRRLGRFSLTRPQAVMIVFAGMLVFLVGVSLLVGIPAGRQIGRFLQDSNEYLYQIKTRWEQIQGHATWLPDLTGVVDRMLAYVKELTRDEPELARLGLELLRGLGGLVIVLVMTVYMLLQPPHMDRLADWLAPDDRKPRLRAAFAAVSRRFQRWLRAQFIMSLTIGAMTFLGLLVLRIRYPHLLALVAAVGELIPVAGPILAGIPAVLVAMTQSLGQAIAVALLAVAIQAFENYVLLPKVMRDLVGIPPLVTITGMLVGFELLGILGAIMALPVAAALGILIPEVLAALAAPAPLSGTDEPPKGDASPRSPRDARDRRAASD